MQKVKLFLSRAGKRGRSDLRAPTPSQVEVALIAEAEVPAEYAHVDEDLEDWRP